MGLDIIMVTHVVELRNVKKRFGKVEALRGISFEVFEGEIFGLIGPNGAGKTTTLRIIATLVKHDEGMVKVLGYELPKFRNEVRGKIAYLPEDSRLYGRLNGWENLLYFAMIYSESKEEAIKMARLGAEISGLSWSDLMRRASEYSRGMARRIAVARTLMTKAPLVILDEPTTGLDVFSSYAIRQIIKRYARELKVTIILSSHNMLEIQDLCDRVALINKGRIVAVGTPNEIIVKAKASNLEEAFIRLVGDVSE